MAIGHWIGGALGAFIGGPLGAIAGAVLGGFVQKKVIDNDNFTDSDDAEHFAAEHNTQRNDFLFTFLVLASYIIQADGRIMHSEMEALRRMLRQIFGEQAVEEGGEILERLFEHRKSTIAQLGRAAYERLIAESCEQVRERMDEAGKLELADLLCDLAKADGRIDPAEITALRQVARAIGLEEAEIDALLSMGSNDLNDAYRVLELRADASDEEVKKAYKRLALKHHPDRVATLGEDVRKAAEKKFQELGAAKDRIYKARGLK